MMKTPPIFSTTGEFGNSRASITWQDRDHRYHAWFQREDDVWNVVTERARLYSEERKVTIYRQALQVAERGSRVQHLDGRAEKWTPILNAARAFANSGAIEAATKAREDREEAKAREEAAKANLAHAAYMRRALVAFADELGTDTSERTAVRLLARYLTDDQLNRLSAYVHDVVEGFQ